MKNEYQGDPDASGGYHCYLVTVGWENDKKAVKGFEGERYKDATCFIQMPKSGNSYMSYPNLCVNEDNQYIPRTEWIKGDSIEEVCQHECEELENCTGYNWFAE